MTKFETLVTYFRAFLLILILKIFLMWFIYFSAPILRRKKDGDWYIYPQFVANENFKNVHKKAQKGCKIFKPTIHNVLSTGTTIVKIWLSLCLIRCLRFARYCGKMYSRHLFSYGGLEGVFLRRKKNTSKT